MKRGRLFFWLCLCIVCGLRPCPVYAVSYYEDSVDYTQIQAALDEADTGGSFDFGGYVTDLISGKEVFSFSGILQKAKTAFLEQLRANLSGFSRIITIAVAAAVFTNFSLTFRNGQVAETGFYVAYLMLAGALGGLFLSASALAAQTLSSVLHFMQVLLPAYCITVALSVGTSTSAIFYEATMLLITVADVILVKLIVPAVNICMMLRLANYVTKEETLSKLSQLLQTLIRWGIRSLLALVLSIGTVQGMIAPALDKLKRSAAVKTASAIPGIGNLLGGAAETVLAAGVVLKNAVGVAGTVAVFLLCAVPLLKLLLYVLLYRFGGALLQPISDKRVLGCLEAFSEAAGLLLQAVFTGAVLFLLVIAMLALTAK